MDSSARPVETLDALAVAAQQLGQCDSIDELAGTACRLAVKVVPGVRDAEVVRALGGGRTMTLAATGESLPAQAGDPVVLPVPCRSDALVLQLYPERELDGTERRVARLYAVEVSTAAHAAHTAVRATNLERALSTCRDIGVAMGIIMARRACTRDQALELLRRASRAMKRKVASVAADVAETGILEFEPSGREPLT